MQSNVIYYSRQYAKPKGNSVSVYFDFLHLPVLKDGPHVKVYIVKLLMISTNWPNVPLIEALPDICKSYSLPDKFSQDQI